MARARKGRDKQGDAAAAAGRRGRRLPIWKKALFALAATLLFFVLLEAVLWIVGVDPLSSSDDPYVGFASGSPLYEAKQRADGKVFMVTAPAKQEWFAATMFPREKPPRAVRVFCLGGSTTYGRPNGDRTSFCGWLRALLPQADPSRAWELINAGGISYASYRLVRVMEELTEYEPDVFIVYTGHNEFLERRTYPRLVDTPGWILDLGSTLSKTRTYALAHGLLTPDASAQDGGDARSILPAEVQTMLDRTVGPEEYSRAVLQRDAAVRHFRLNLERMVAVAREAGARIVFVKPASNLKDMSPFKSEPGDGIEAWDATLVTQAIAEGRRLLATGSAHEALATLRGALQRDTQNAALHYELGRALLAAGDVDAARQSFQRAVDEDVCPLRAPAVLEETVASVAGALDVPLVDFRSVLEARCRDEHGHRILGGEYFLDHVHPSVATHRLLALALIDRLGEMGVVHPSQRWSGPAVEAVSRRVLAAFDERAQAMEQCNLAKVLLWAGKTEEALQYSRQAVAVLPEALETLVIAGVAARTQGLHDEAIGYLRRAAASPEANVYHKALLHVELGEALLAAGAPAEAVKHVRSALGLYDRQVNAHAVLGTALARLDRHAEAIAELEQGLALWPDDPRLLLLRAVEHIWQQDDAAALKRLDRALSLRPGYAEASLQRARLLEKARRWAEADEAFAGVLRADSLHVGAWLGRGRVLTALGRLEASREHHERLLRLAPDEPAAHGGLAEALAAQAAARARAGDLAAARTMAERALVEARRAGRAELAATIEQRLRSYGKPGR